MDFVVRRGFVVVVACADGRVCGVTATFSGIKPHSFRNVSSFVLGPRGVSGPSSVTHVASPLVSSAWQVSVLHSAGTSVVPLRTPFDVKNDH